MKECDTTALVKLLEFDEPARLGQFFVSMHNSTAFGFAGVVTDCKFITRGEVRLGIMLSGQPRTTFGGTPSSVLRLAMEQHSATFCEIAKETGISESTLLRFAKGRPITLPNFDRLATFLGLTIGIP